MTHESCKQAAAALLISGFLWTFCACLLFCGDLGCGNEVSGAKLGLVVVHETDSDACPVNVAAKAVNADRNEFVNISLNLTNPRHGFIPRQRNDSPRSEVSLPRVVFASPPLERLPVLRI